MKDEKNKKLWISAEFDQGKTDRDSIFLITSFS